MICFLNLNCKRYAIAFLQYIDTYINFRKGDAPKCDLRGSNPGVQPAYLAGLTTRAELGSQGVIFSSQAFLVLQQTGSHN